MRFAIVPRVAQPLASGFDQLVVSPDGRTSSMWRAPVQAIHLPAGTVHNLIDESGTQLTLLPPLSRRVPDA